MYKNFKISTEDPVNRPFVNAYFNGFNATFRLFDRVVLDEAPENLLDKASLFTEDNLKHCYFVLNEEANMYFKCVYSKTITLDAKIWKPYRLIYFCITTHVDRRDSACFVDRYAETYLSKMGHNNWNKFVKMAGGITLMRWIVLPGSNLETAPCFMSNDVNVVTNISFEKSWEYVAGEDKPYIDAWENYYIPSIEVVGNSTIKANSVENFELRVTHKDGEVCLDPHTYYVECLQGYAPNREVKVENGVGNFNIMALGLNPGDKLRFKINDRLWSDKTEKILDVIE